ncbi:NAD(P)/FAD-dependent oxidoreductase [Palleronia sp. LCG004]|uniref:flavin-containing monooxygenase n=1 Tax=Palleronia sp. LCG004 TaxID=3079304 RepID=UPI002942D86C|nr:NAD(P)/FAD-dependent oxidoreductase [Palleronia sp. LCG004]WOI57205.1 NAD(P)/FAD-dependent oxidoreductase [Palleronia sp. LCG004]
MSIERVDTLVVGAGQAGIAMSEHLGRAGVDHVVLERSRIAEGWRSKRWDSLVANGPAWHDRFPGMEFKAAPGAFVGKDGVAEYLDDYASMLNAPIRTGVEVVSVERLDGRQGFHVETSEGVVEALNVVAATGPFQTAVIPPVVPDGAGLTQIHSSQYRNPSSLSEGAVLVVGAGSSGVQIADELNRSGRRVFLSVGPHDRPPRAYRDRDFVWWLGVLGLWNMETPAPGTEHVTIAVSGARGGETIDFRNLANQGITLLGRTETYVGGKLSFAPDLRRNIEGGDQTYLDLLRAADAYAAENGLDLPEEPEAHELGPLPDHATDPVLSLDLKEAGITTIIWATGFGFDYSWMKVDCFDENGRPIHQRGVGKVPGIFFLGLPWQSRRGSSFIWGVWHDAKHVADQITTSARYIQYDREARSEAQQSKAPATESV